MLSHLTTIARFVAAVAVVGCARETPEPVRVSAPSGLGKLEAALQASDGAAHVDDPVPTASELFEADAKVLVDAETVLGLFQESLETPANVDAIDDTGTRSPLGTVESGRRPTLLPTQAGIFVASESGLRLLGVDGPLVDRDPPMTAAVLDDDVIVAATCDGGPCEIVRYSIATRSLEPVTDARFENVDALAVWGTAVYVAGRERAVPPKSRAEIVESARWLASDGATGSVASSTYPPGFLAKIEPDGSVTRWEFPDHRPHDLAVQDDALFVLTSGTLRRNFSDGVLFRIARDDSWEVLATPLDSPNSLVLAPERACWAASPASGFALQCLDLASKTLRTVARHEFGITALAVHGDEITWSVMMNGTFRAPLD